MNFDVLTQRNSMYRAKECQSLREFEAHKDEELAQLREDLRQREEQMSGEKHYV